MNAQQLIELSDKCGTIRQKKLAKMLWRALEGLRCDDQQFVSGNGGPMTTCLERETNPDHWCWNCAARRDIDRIAEQEPDQ